MPFAPGYSQSMHWASQEAVAVSWSDEGPWLLPTSLTLLIVACKNTDTRLPAAVQHHAACGSHDGALAHSSCG